MPSIQADVMMIPASRHKCRLPPVSLRQLESEHAAIERERPLQIGDLQMDMAYARAGIDRLRVERRSEFSVIKRN